MTECSMTGLVMHVVPLHESFHCSFFFQSQELPRRLTTLSFTLTRMAKMPLNVIIHSHCSGIAVHMESFLGDGMCCDVLQTNYP